MKQFISCDWGTSAFRLRLVEAATRNIITETKSAQGIAATNDLWNLQASKDRMNFYGDFLLQQIHLLEKQCGHSLSGAPLVISGMASSTIGMRELPYKSVSFKIKTSELEISVIPLTEKFRHQIILISGVRSYNDVMRGEETMLAGCAIKDQPGKQLFIFPGTHSKHIIVQDSIVVDFKTYMTGELFKLLCSKSVLAASIEEDDSTDITEPFLKGVHDVTSMNFLNSIFHVRTNTLFDKVSKKDNYHYLSGLLIGEELKGLLNENYITITIVSTGVLSALYCDALSATGFRDKLFRENADDALINGQALIFNQLMT